MDASLSCSVAIEELSLAGNVIKKAQYRNLTLTLGRDEFKEVQLKITFPKKESKYSVKELLVHKKFMKDGKATIKLPDQKIQFMLSNCPPDKLTIFIKTLQMKLECLKQKGFMTNRAKLLSGKQHDFEEISPLTVKDVQTAKSNASAKMPVSSLASSSSSSNLTLNGKKRPNREQENLSCTQKERETKKQKLLHDQCELLKKAKLNGISPSKILIKPVQLSKEQTRVLETVLKGRSIFFTGSAGTGKSFLLKRILGALPPRHTFATASTGVAACHIGGTTLHSFAGIGSGKAPLEQCIQLASRQRVAQQWKACKHLIIDEISMVDGDMFDKLETVARVIRKSDLPFGGIQLIVCGDFLQLPPVTRQGEIRKFCFQSDAWHKSIDVTMELSEVRRQADKHFINILQHIRKGICPDVVADTLLATSKNSIQKDGILATKLCTHKMDVEDINVAKLKFLQGQSRLFTATDSDQVYAELLNTLCPVPAYLDVKVGAQVMLCKNLDIQRGLVNGARGVISGYEKNNEAYPIVKFVCGVTEVIKPSRWVFKIGGGNTIVRKQVPLKLAWAISIHKSQGMTLDCVEISLSRVFETGQAYVALSRAKSLDGLRLIDFDRKAVRADPKVLEFYKQLDLRHRMMHNGIEDDNEIFRPNRSKFAPR